MESPTDKPIHLLHLHSHYSVLDAVSSLGEYIAYAKEHELCSCACTEHGFTLGVYDLITKCEKAGIKPIPGMEAYLMPREGETFVGKPKRYYHLTLWAQSQQGYASLLALSNRSWIPGRVEMAFGNPKPRITWEDLEMHNEGLICGSGCILGPIVSQMLDGNKAEAYRSAAMLKAIFGDRLFMEVMPSSVTRNYTREPVVQVESEEGVGFTFLPTDTVMTPEGRMGVEEAMEKGIEEIWEPIPQRNQDGTIAPPQQQQED